MTTVGVSLVIDGTIEHRVDIGGLVDAPAPWDARITAFMRDIQGWITQGDVTAFPLDGGGQVVVSWRTVRTVEVRP
ncbi:MULTISPECIES: hypothetical protein [unclassified Pseudofrankia]|uniref:hypothetical protein n=1 Tax=unclassified Pseudofrankia TaxID=2994372 RepID=UPI0008DA7690|nr:MULTISPECIES: hypothetical protein [unclassified Pseudofrankia]MDT3439508.1 hypothetical protein [Pseudofrankia sp. BMG5.37]OHV48695.1 hypothetical protein BCD48_14765 [Pseudofrankia sp. BMG5.36]